MGIIFNPKYNNLPQQVGQNKADIEMLKKEYFKVYKTTSELGTQSTSVYKDTTNIQETDPIEN